MNIGNEQEAQEAIESWRGDSLSVQLRNLRQAVEKLELGQMYYDQKGNANGVERLGDCLKLLAARKAEIDQELS